jgi:hypothetical protein
MFPVAVVVSYHTWRKILFNLASTLCTEFNIHGLLGAITAEIDYARMIALPPPPAGDPANPPFEPFVPPPHPGVLPAAANAQAAYTNASKIYRSYQTAMSELKTFMLASLDITTYPTFEDPAYGSINLTPANILRRLDAHYLHMTPDDSEQMKLVLAEFFVDTAERSLNTFIQKHREIHVIFANNGTLINERDKYVHLRNPVSVVPFYESIVSTFKYAVPKFPLQTFDIYI